jgi:hypothetical protein
MVKRLMFALLVLGGCSTKANPNACCVSADDCSQAGLESVTACGDGLTCVNNQCTQETCSTDGCSAATPVCNVVTNACDVCTDSSQCASYPGQTVCDTSSGACVGCVTTADCPTATPVCDTGRCRACATDSDCPSGACADDGNCVPESEIVYIDPAGTDAGNCTSDAPCRSMLFAVTKASGTRDHLVMHPGAYVEHVQLVGNGSTAPLLHIHGGGSTLSQPTGNDGGLLGIANVDIQYLDLINDSGRALDITNGSLRHSHVRAHGNEIDTYGVVMLEDVVVGPGGDFGVLVGSGTLTMDRVQITGEFTTAVKANSYDATINASNMLIYSGAGLAMDLSMAAGGTISFSTIADSGADMGTGPRSINCSSNVTFRSSIVWAPGSVSRVPIQGCNVVSSIVGPTAISGVTNTDPLFVSSATHDYHLSAGSPAIDAADFGPDHDFEGDARPSGSRFDIGADEAH